MKDIYLIIDGYNLIGQSKELSSIAQVSLEEARDKLLITLINYNTQHDGEMIVVFDAYGVEGTESIEIKHGVKVVYTKGKETADSYIEKLTYELYRKHITHITVVTSDMSEQHAIFGSGAYRISSREMWTTISNQESVVTKHLSEIETKTPRNRLNLPDEVLAQFEKWRRNNK
ncbi:NYN domain-containing protein [Mammaliicoccus sp. Dog046]|uniref:NYN domain-containing protein n=1 Tax=Mammaliicoccus sp. Dog046 TaxID=3034233 RepID=UPI002B25F07E|nr:NYN domain-containing protein [Mammaliicoccus sp. Dog046]WQK85307.1 NYN domain-containing protein [Mammaliicoccus sp. Dog046]